MPVEVVVVKVDQVAKVVPGAKVVPVAVVNTPRPQTSVTAKV